MHPTPRRRAIRYGHKLGVKEPFFHLLVPVFASSATWGDEGPTLVAQRQVQCSGGEVLPHVILTLCGFLCSAVAMIRPR